MNTKYRVTVRRIIREDIEMIVEAPDAESARHAAELEATTEPQEKWDTYDCDYMSDDAQPVQ